MPNVYVFLPVWLFLASFSCFYLCFYHSLPLFLFSLQNKPAMPRKAIQLIICGPLVGNWEKLWQLHPIGSSSSNKIINGRKLRVYSFIGYWIPVSSSLKTLSHKLIWVNKSWKHLGLRLDLILLAADVAACLHPFQLLRGLSKPPEEYGQEGGWPNKSSPCTGSSPGGGAMGPTLQCRGADISQTSDSPLHQTPQQPTNQHASAPHHGNRQNNNNSRGRGSYQKWQQQSAGVKRDISKRDQQPDTGRHGVTGIRQWSLLPDQKHTDKPKGHER